MASAAKSKQIARQVRQDRNEKRAKAKANVFRDPKDQMTDDDWSKLDAYAGDVESGKSKAVNAVFDIGRALEHAQRLLSNKGNGNFTKWATERCGLSRSTAFNCLRAWKTFGDCPNFGRSCDYTALYLLSEEATPEAARQRARELVADNKWITFTLARQIIDEAKKPKATAPVDFRESDTEPKEQNQANQDGGDAATNDQEDPNSREHSDAREQGTAPVEDDQRKGARPKDAVESGPADEHEATQRQPAPGILGSDFWEAHPPAEPMPKAAVKSLSWLIDALRNLIDPCLSKLQPYEMICLSDWLETKMTEIRKKADEA